MSSHTKDANKIESIMVKLNLEKTDSNLPHIASQELDLPIKYIKTLIASNVGTLEQAKEKIKIQNVYEEIKKNR